MRNYAIGVHYTPDFDVLEKWASGKLLSTRPRPPTWRSLFEVMRELDLEELSQEIEEYLSCECMDEHFGSYSYLCSLSYAGPRSLKEQCTSAIVSVLLQQTPLEPDQLHVRLPDYVPPRVKCSITDAFMQGTHPPTTCTTTSHTLPSSLQNTSCG